MSAPVLVTGAGGFIGRAVVARLAEAGIPVRAGLRRMPATSTPGPDAVACDLDRPGELDAACAGAGTIVHAAGRSRATMATHLRALLDAAGRAGVGRVVLFSSVAVYGAREGRVAEDDAPGDLDAYGSAKRDCEAMLRGWVREGAESGRRAMILRPGIVYGRGSDLWIDRPAACLRAGTLGHLGSHGEGVAALIHVSDVADATRAAVLALGPAGPGERALNLVGPDTPTWNAYLAALSERLGLGPPRTVGPVERAVSRLLAPPAKVLARAGLPIPDALRLVPAAGELRLYARAARYDTARAERVLGLRPTVGLARGLAESLPGSGSPRRAAYGAEGETATKAPAKAASAESAPAAR